MEPANTDHQTRPSDAAAVAPLETLAPESAAPQVVEAPLLRCEVCRGLIDEGDLFCVTCGREAPHSGNRRPAVKQLVTHNFECGSCGAGMSYDASAKALRCPFCGSVDLEQRPDATAVQPEVVIPFGIDQDAAEQVMRTALAKGFWRPSDLAQTASVVKMQGVFVPCWVFSAEVHVYYTGDTDQRQGWQNADWRPVAGEHSFACENLLVAASGALTQSEMTRIAPFRLSEGVPGESVDLENSIVEQFGLSRKLARPLAMTGIQDQAQGACSALIPGKSRNVHVNPLLSGLSSRPALVPVWIMAYRYKDRTFRFLVNGQTGEGFGAAPQSVAKMAGCVLAVIFAIATGVAAILFAAR